MLQINNYILIVFIVNSYDSIMTDLSHHKQQELCRTRPAYRQGRNLTAVKVSILKLTRY